MSVKPYSVPLPFERDVGVPEPYGACEHLRLDLTSLQGVEETYNPIQAAVDIFNGFRLHFKCWRQLQTYSNGTGYQNANFFSDLAAVGHVELVDIVVVILMTLAWTAARFGLCNYVFQPFCRIWKMHKVNSEKFPESAFKTTAYFVLWASACYVTFFRNHTFFSNSLSLWSDCRYKFGHASLDLRLVYGLEASFYFHSCYTCLFLDKWKRDSPVMLLHHIVTLTLVLFSYYVSYLKIGVIIFVLNDCSDVMLEAAKCFAYMKIKGARFAGFWNTLATVCSSIFAVTWVFLRNLLHLTKVWRSSAIGSMYSMPYLPNPLYLFFNILVGSLYGFYCYWLYFIIIFIVRVWSGKMKEPDDIRDEEVEEEYMKAAQNPDSIDGKSFDSSDSELDRQNSTWTITSPGSKGRKAD